MRQLVVWGELGVGVREAVEQEGRWEGLIEAQQAVEGAS
jgi:hypothetical protein